MMMKRVDLMSHGCNKLGFTEANKSARKSARKLEENEGRRRVFFPKEA